MGVAVAVLEGEVVVALAPLLHRPRAGALLPPAAALALAGPLLEPLVVPLVVALIVAALLLRAAALGEALVVAAVAAAAAVLLPAAQQRLQPEEPGLGVLLRGARPNIPPPPPVAAVAAVVAARVAAEQAEDPGVPVRPLVAVAEAGLSPPPPAAAGVVSGVEACALLAAAERAAEHGAAEESRAHTENAAVNELAARADEPRVRGHRALALGVGAAR